MCIVMPNLHHYHLLQQLMEYLLHYWLYNLDYYFQSCTIQTTLHHHHLHHVNNIENYLFVLVDQQQS